MKNRFTTYASFVLTIFCMQAMEMNNGITTDLIIPGQQASEEIEKLTQLWGTQPHFELWNNQTDHDIYVRIGNKDYPITQDSTVFTLAPNMRLVAKDHITQLAFSLQENPEYTENVEYYLFSENKDVFLDITSENNQIIVNEQAGYKKNFFAKLTTDSGLLMHNMAHADMQNIQKSDIISIPYPYLPFKNRLLQMVRDNSFSDFATYLQWYELTDDQKIETLTPDKYPKGWTPIHEAALNQPKFFEYIEVPPNLPLFTTVYGLTYQNIPTDPRIQARTEKNGANKNVHGYTTQIINTTSEPIAKLKLFNVKNLITSQSKRLATAQVGQESSKILDFAADMLIFAQQAKPNFENIYCYAYVGNFDNQLIKIKKINQYTPLSIVAYNENQQEKKWVKFPYGALGGDFAYKVFGENILPKTNILQELIKSPEESKSPEAIIEDIKTEEISKTLYYTIFYTDHTPGQKPLESHYRGQAIPLLHFAIWFKNIKWIRYLLKQGFDKYDRDENGFTAIQLANFLEKWFTQVNEPGNKKIARKIALILADN